MYRSSNLVHGIPGLPSAAVVVSRYANQSTWLPALRESGDVPKRVMGHDPYLQGRKPHRLMTRLNSANSQYMYASMYQDRHKYGVEYQRDISHHPRWNSLLIFEYPCEPELLLWSYTETGYGRESWG